MSPTGTVKEYAILSTTSKPNGIATGPDGDVWFTEYSTNKIGVLTTSGSSAEYQVPTPNSGVFGIASGPDGALWFTESSSNKIGRIATTGAISEYPVPTGAAGPAYVALGPDGNLWFTETGSNKIGWITPGGVIRDMSVPTAGSAPNGIAAGPDGNLWFTEYNGNKIGRIGPCIECAPGAMRCNNHQPQTCGTDTLWKDNGTSCPYVCSSGSCTGICVPGATQCTSGGLQTCGSDGQWGTAVACSGSTPVCSSSTCVACSVGATQCSDGGVQTCGQDNQWASPVACSGATPACVEGVCVSDTASPCAGLCNPVLISGPSYNSGSLGTGAVCLEMDGSLSAIFCSNFINRTFIVNGVVAAGGGQQGQPTTCNFGNSVPPQRNGGYCFQATAGDPSYAGFSTG